MMRIGIALLLLVACSQPEKEVISINEVLPKPTKVDSSAMKLDSALSPKSIYVDLSVESQAIIKALRLDTALIEPLKNKLFVDRFASEKVEKWQGVGPEGKTIKGAIWTYADSAQAKNAFFNWLDCFGPRCMSLRLLESKHLVDASFLWVLDQNCMIFIQGVNNEQFMSNDAPLHGWMMQEPWMYALTQTVKGKCRWLKKNNETKHLQFEPEKLVDKK